MEKRAPICRGPEDNLKDDFTPTLEVNTASPGSSAGPSLRPRLRVVNPIELATEIDVGPERLILGRAPSTPAGRLSHPTVSREHLATWIDASRVLWVEDLQSRNGVFLNGAPLKMQASLQIGGVLRFGDVVAIYEQELGPETPTIEELPGPSAAMARLRSGVLRAAPSPAPVLIGGQTGTGKERVARAIHRLSGRSGPFLAVNCAELSPELFAGALFGHERGAFTGAESARLGLIRSAEGGTLLLDEIGELALELQAKLLRVLEEREVLPLGASRPVPIDVRFLASTHRDLLEAVQAGTFRRDLYARLGLHELLVPSLAQRPSDILEWLLRFAREAEGTEALESFALDGSAAEWLLLRGLPGNLRDLKALALRARAADSSRRWSRSALEALVPKASGSATPAPSAAAPVPPAKPPVPTKEELEHLLATHGSVRGTAKALGRDRRQIYRWIEAFGLKRPLD
jgi:DNA-binding NtrC family response regulator